MSWRPGRGPALCRQCRHTPALRCATSDGWTVPPPRCRTDLKSYGSCRDPLKLSKTTRKKMCKKSLCMIRISEVQNLNFNNSGCVSCRVVREMFPVPDSGSASKNLSILTQKIVSKLSEIWSRLFIPYPGIQGSKRHRIRDPDPQHWFLEWSRLRILLKMYILLKTYVKSSSWCKGGKRYKCIESCHGKTGNFVRKGEWDDFL